MITLISTHTPFSIRLANIATLDFTKTSVRHVIVKHLTSIIAQLYRQISGVLFNMMQCEREFFLICIGHPERPLFHFVQLAGKRLHHSGW